MGQLALSRAALGRSNVLPGLVKWAAAIGLVAFNNVFGATALKLLLHAPYWLGLLLIFAGEAAISILGHEAGPLHGADLGFIVAFAVSAMLYAIPQRTPATSVSAEPVGDSIDHNRPLNLMRRPAAGRLPLSNRQRYANSRQRQNAWPPTLRSGPRRVLCGLPVSAAFVPAT